MFTENAKCRKGIPVVEVPKGYAHILIGMVRQGISVDEAVTKVARHIYGEEVEEVKK